MNILNQDNEMRPGLLTEDKIVDIKILRTYLDNLNLHRTEFEMNKFVVKPKTLKGITKLSKKEAIKGSVFKGKVSIFDSYKQVVLEDKKLKRPRKKSIFTAKEPSFIEKAFSNHHKSFNQDTINQVFLILF